MRLPRLLGALFLLSLTSCVAPKKNKKHHTLIAEKRFDYTMRVEGVECRRCASNVLHMLQYVAGLHDVNCLCPKDRFEQAVFTFWAGAQKFSVADLMEKLVHEDFKLQAIRGTFDGHLISDKTGALNIQLLGLKAPIAFLSERALPESASLSPVEFEGTLIWSQQDNCYVFLDATEPEAD